MSCEWEILRLFPGEIDPCIHFCGVMPLNIRAGRCYPWRKAPEKTSQRRGGFAQLVLETSTGPAPPPHTLLIAVLCSLTHSLTQGALMRKSIHHLLTSCWLSFLLLLVCLPSHCISSGKCFISWVSGLLVGARAQASSGPYESDCVSSQLLLWAAWAPESRRGWGCRRHSAPPRSQYPAVPVPLDWQKFWQAEELATGWKS